MKVLSLKPRIGKRSFLSLKLYIEHEIKAILGKETLWSLFPKGSICLGKKKSEIIFRLLKFLTVITLEIYVYMYLLLFTPYAWNV